jgi:hypothetical protein
MSFTFHGNLIPPYFDTSKGWGLSGAGLLVEEVIGFHIAAYRSYMR